MIYVDHASKFNPPGGYLRTYRCPACCSTTVSSSNRRVWLFRSVAKIQRCSLHHFIHSFCAVHASVLSNVYVEQWDLFIKDTLGPTNLSTVERVSTLQRWKMY